eukprot:6370481-Amphidinium_carterae.1
MELSLIRRGNSENTRSRGQGKSMPTFCAASSDSTQIHPCRARGCHGRARPLSNARVWVLRGMEACPTIAFIRLRCCRNPAH